MFVHPEPRFWALPAKHSLSVSPALTGATGFKLCKPRQMSRSGAPIRGIGRINPGGGSKTSSRLHGLSNAEIEDEVCFKLESWVGFRSRGR